MKSLSSDTYTTLQAFSTCQTSYNPDQTKNYPHTCRPCHHSKTHSYPQITIRWLALIHGFKYLWRKGFLTGLAHEAILSAARRAQNIYNVAQGREERVRYSTKAGYVCQGFEVELGTVPCSLAPLTHPMAYVQIEGDGLPICTWANGVTWGGGGWWCKANKCYSNIFFKYKYFLNDYESGEKT
jgi:hypothetical protein